MLGTLIYHEAVLALPQTIDLESARERLLPMLEMELRGTGSENILRSDERITFEGGCFSSNWCPGKMVTEGKIGIEARGTEVFLSYHVSFREMHVITRYIGVGILAMILLFAVILLLVVGWLGSLLMLLFMLPNLALLWFVSAVVQIHWARSTVRRFFERVVSACCLELEKDRAGTVRG